MDDTTNTTVDDEREPTAEEQQTEILRARLRILIAKALEGESPKGGN